MVDENTNNNKKKIHIKILDYALINRLQTQLIKIKNEILNHENLINSNTKPIINIEKKVFFFLTWPCY
jgi:hypothetical protein